jgi:hypothetical protein
MKGIYDSEIDMDPMDNLNRGVVGYSTVAYCLRSPRFSVSTRLESEERPDPEVTEYTGPIPLALDEPPFRSVQP